MEVDAMGAFKFPEVTWHEKPFRYAVLRHAWDLDFLFDCMNEFPPADDDRWVEHPDPEELGKKQGGEDLWGPNVAKFFEVSRSAEVTQWLEEQTGIYPLTADDIGGGMHETGEGGRLEMHVDFNVHPFDFNLERRINMLTFLNPVWERNWGGVLKLGLPKEQVELLPKFGITVLFECSDVSFHGHPDPVVGNHLRRSLACYYYAPSRVTVGEEHTTLWKPEHADA